MISIQEVADEFVKDCRFRFNEPVFISNTSTNSFTVSMRNDDVVIVIDSSVNLQTLNNVNELKAKKLSHEEYDKLNNKQPGSSKAISQMMKRMNMKYGGPKDKGQKVFNVDNDSRGNATWEKATTWTRQMLLKSNYGYGNPHPEYVAQQEELKRSASGNYKKPSGFLKTWLQACEFINKASDESVAIKVIMALCAIGGIAVGLSSGLVSGLFTVMGLWIIMFFTLVLGEYMRLGTSAGAKLIYFVVSIPLWPIIIPVSIYGSWLSGKYFNKMHYRTNSDGLVRFTVDDRIVEATPIDLDIIKRGLLGPSGLVWELGSVNGVRITKKARDIATHRGPMISTKEDNASSVAWLEGLDTPRSSKSLNNTISASMNKMTGKPGPMPLSNGNKPVPKTPPANQGGTSTATPPKKTKSWKKNAKLDPDVNF